jgi:hypothetical protein
MGDASEVDGRERKAVPAHVADGLESGRAEARLGRPPNSVYAMLGRVAQSLPGLRVCGAVASGASPSQSG